MKILSAILLLAAIFCTSCEVIDEASGLDSQAAGLTPNYGQPLTAEVGQGRVVIREGTQVLATLSSAKPNVEETRWYSEQEQIVIKSRGNHGPAVVELFSSRSGRRLGSVMAYEAANGPNWARSMAE